MSKATALLLVLAFTVVLAAPPRVPESLLLAQAKGIIAACFNFTRNSPDPLQSAGKITVAIVDNAGQLKAFASDGSTRSLIVFLLTPAQMVLLEAD
jgi:hypothetical protein